MMVNNGNLWRFHSHGGIPQWMIYKAKSQSKMNDEQVHPYLRKPPK